MSKHRLISQQNLTDFALQHYGDIAAIFTIAANNASALPGGLSDINPAPVELETGRNINIAGFLPNFYANRLINIATGGVVVSNPVIDANWILAEDNTPLLAEDGTNLLYE